MKSTILAAMVIVAALFSACGSTDPTPVVVKNYMSLKSGNYWIYDRQVIDSATNTPKGEAVSDSAFVMDSLSYNGMGAFRVVTVRTDKANDTSYYAKSANGELYTFIDAKNSLLDSVAKTLVPPKRWVRLSAAEGVNDWTAFDTTYTGITLDLTKLVGSTLPNASINFKVTGTKGAAKSVSVAGRTYDAQEYIQNFAISVNSGTISSLVTQHYLFIENVGIYQTRTEASYVRTGFSTTPVYSIPGSQSTLTRFTLK